MKKAGVYLYDSITGKYKDSYPSYTALENALGLYSGAVSDSFRRKGTKGKLVCSKIKYDIYPGFEGSTELIQKEQISVPKPSGAVLTEEQLRIKHDMFFRVMQFIRNIPKGSFIEETQMLRELGILGKPRFRDAITRPELKEYKGKVDGMTYYGNSESINKLKQEGVLQ